ncbi:helicase C-terminal domain-containing protein [Vibrio mediterranei]
MEIGEIVVRDIKETLVSLEGKMPNFRRRKCQLQMVNDMRQMLLHDGAAKNLVCELAPGGGKTMGYLLGAVPHALAAGLKVVVSAGSMASHQHILDEVSIFASAFSKSFAYVAVSDDSEDETIQAVMNDADVIVVTHKLLARDIVLGGSVLLPSPSDAIYIIDDADCLASKLREGLSLAYCPSLEHAKSASGSWREICANEDLAQPYWNYVKTLARFEEKFEEYRYSHLRDQKISYFSNGLIPASISELANDTLCCAVELREALIMSCCKYSKTSQFGEYGKKNEQWFIEECDRKIASLSSMVNTLGDGYSLARWLEVGVDGQVFFRAAHLNTGGLLANHYWSRNSGVVITSSTLRHDDAFDVFSRECGFIGQTVLFKSYGSPFDYQAQGTLLVPDIPFEPKCEEFTIWLKSCVFRYLTGATSSLVVFYSSKQMYQVRAYIEASCTHAGILLQCEGDSEMNVLLSNHAKAVSKGIPSVIFGTHRVLDGLSLNGDLLVNLIIVRLPFESLDSPVSIAQVEYEREKGRAPFDTVTLPTACRALTKTVGHLIRSESDSGRCVILDRRIKTRNYGARFIDSLPPFKRSTEFA